MIAWPEVAVTWPEAVARLFEQGSPRVFRPPLRYGEGMHYVAGRVHLRPFAARWLVERAFAEETEAWEL